MRKKENNNFALIDNNILDKPLYIINQRFWEISENLLSSENEKEIYIIAKKTISNKDKEESYSIEVKKRLPTNRDNLVLFSVISIAQEKKNPYIITSIYEILKKIGWGTSKKEYEFVLDSLSVWFSLSFEYKNCFYTHTGKDSFLKTRVISHLYKKEDGKLEIIIQPKVFEMLTANKFFSVLDLKEYASLKSGFQRRLYEILIKSFNANLIFYINWKNLRNKLEDNSTYKSEFMKKIRRALNAIERSTSLKVDYSLDNELIYFTIKDEIKTQFINLINFLLDYYEKFDIDIETVEQIRVKCNLEKVGDLYILVCKDMNLQSELLKNSKLTKGLYLKGIKIGNGYSPISK